MTKKEILQEVNWWRGFYLIGYRLTYKKKWVIMQGSSGCILMLRQDYIKNAKETLLIQQ